MPSCVVKICRNHSGLIKKSQGITFHRFPSANILWKNDWIQIIRLCRNENDWNPSKSSVICSDHFEANDLYTTKGGLLRVVTYAVPKKLLCEPPSIKEENVTEANIFSPSHELVDPLSIQDHPAEGDISCTLNGISVKLEAIGSSSEDQLTLDEFCSQNPTSSIPQNLPKTEPASPAAIDSEQPLPIVYRERRLKLVDQLSIQDHLAEGDISCTLNGISVKLEAIGSSCEDELTLDEFCSQNPTSSIPQYLPKTEPAPASPVAIDSEQPLPIVYRERRLKASLMKMEILMKKKNKIIKILKQKVRRLESRNKSLKGVLKTLREKNYIDEDLCSRLNENIIAADFFNNFNRIKLKKNMQYSPSMKKFCVTLNYYSPKAYDYVRQTFDTCLPHRKTLLKWFVPLKGEPEFTEEP